MEEELTIDRKIDLIGKGLKYRVEFLEDTGKMIIHMHERIEHLEKKSKSQEAIIDEIFRDIKNIKQ